MFIIKVNRMEIDKELNDFTSFTFALIQVMGFNCQQSFTYNYVRHIYMCMCMYVYIEVSNDGGTCLTH